MPDVHDTLCGCDACVEAEHQAEVARLTRERDEAMKNLTMLHIEWRAELANLRALLRELEWSSCGDCVRCAGCERWQPQCPECGRCHACGHAADCRLKAALE